ncbi:MAG: hypothetical protein JRN62_04050 [Nitrososphaerota archaeon]|nr:hypothetical protein [Nitrososphaerota archaeon]MDG6948776.1 hypothetical protein [Nitrososphaerota archaeon]
MPSSDRTCARCRGEVISDSESGERVCTKCGFVTGYSDMGNEYLEPQEEESEEV